MDTDDYERELRARSTRNTYIGCIGAVVGFLLFTAIYVFMRFTL